MWSSRAALAVFLILIILLALSGALLLLSRPESVEITIHPPPPTATPAPTSTPRPILVYVTGEVARRGALQYLPHGSRVSDAVTAAGGFTDSANRELVNLAGILRDGDQVHIPSSEANSLDDAVPTASGGGLINLNKATLDELMTLPGIGPVTARNIIDFREGVGPYSDLQDLDDVPGIGPSTLAKLAELISLD